ncbi:MAG: hypothetical protein ACR2KI_01950 [Candidatus Limnocylindria bacterium]
MEAAVVSVLSWITVLALAGTVAAGAVAAVLLVRESRSRRR